MDSSPTRESFLSPRPTVLMYWTLHCSAQAGLIAMLSYHAPTSKGEKVFCRYTPGRYHCQRTWTSECWRDRLLGLLALTWRISETKRLRWQPETKRQKQTWSISE